MCTSYIFDYLNKKNNYSSEQINCIEKTLCQLKDQATNANRPGVLLGKIQSGKTKTFIGIIGKAFDNGYDYCIVLTKGTKALAQQTLLRLESEFEDIAQEGEDIIHIYDIMNMPAHTTYVLNKKLILVVKKQTKNLDRVSNFFQEYSLAKGKRILIIDDEADYASVGFQNTKKGLNESEISLRTIAEKIDNVRGLAGSIDFLQVTATPYALYLQPNEKILSCAEYFPTQPMFTELVPIHDQYVGGRVYFEGLNEKNDNSINWAKFLHVEVPQKEIEVLGKPDRRYIKSVLTTPNLEIFRKALIIYLVGGTIRSLQMEPKQYKSSFIIHTAIGKSKHQWQKELVEATIEELKQALEAGDEIAYNHIIDSIQNLKGSFESTNSKIFETDLIINTIKKYLIEGYVAIRSVNSDNDIRALLDKRGQLQLCNPFNIFVGGQILDRGITIENLLGFFYGRDPKTIQQDTVLQHSRMYGARPVENMVLTRLYTTSRLHRVMKKMHEFDAALRHALEQGNHKNGVVFLEKDEEGEIKPCSPNKILISETAVLMPHKRYLPKGFQTKSQSKLAHLIPKTDKFLNDQLIPISISENLYEIKLNAAIDLLQQITDTFEDEHTWDLASIIGILERCCSTIEEDKKLYVLILNHRNMNRYQSDGSFSDAPDGGDVLNKAKKIAQELPCLILTKQNGYEKEGWKGHPFWWPVLVTPKNTKIAIFSSKTNTTKTK